MLQSKKSLLIKGALIGGLTGLGGSIIRPYFLTMNDDPFWIFGIMGIILQISGPFGCNWKRDYCMLEDLLGYVMTTILFSLVGIVISKIIILLKK